MAILLLVLLLAWHNEHLFFGQERSFSFRAATQSYYGHMPTICSHVSEKTFLLSREKVF